MLKIDQILMALEPLDRCLSRCGGFMMRVIDVGNPSS
jgi:hypothetical protein